MLIYKPIGANKFLIDRWNLTNRMTVGIFNAFWQKVSPDLSFPGTKAGDDASPVEWGNDYCKYQGMRNADGQKMSIVRPVVNGNYSFINEATFHEDKLHGLCFTWTNYDDVAFDAAIYDHGVRKAEIKWKSDWSELYSYGNKEMILENNGLSIFKP